MVSEIALDSLFNKALQEQQEGRLNSAIGIYKKVLSLQPKNLDTLYQLGSIYHRQQDFQQANSYYERMLKIYSHSVRALFSLGVLSQQQASFERARLLYQQVLMIEPQHIETLYNLGLLAAHFNKNSQALSFFQQTLQVNPDFFLAHIKQAEIHYKLGSSERAIEHYTLALQLNNNQPEIHYQLAKIYYHSGKIALAIQHFWKTCQLNPQKSEYFIHLGVIYLKNAQYQKAIQMFQCALILSPDSVDSSLVHLALNRLSEQKGEIVELEELLSSDAYLTLGTLFSKQGQYKMAENYLQRAVELQPENSSALQGLGTLYLKQGKYQEALQVYQASLALEPDNERIYSNIASLFLDQGSVDKALDYYKQALKINSDESAIFSNAMFCLRTKATYRDEELFNFASQWDQRIESHSFSFDEWSFDSERAINIGYLSADFCRHSAAEVFKHLYKYRNQHEFKIYSYAQLNVSDDFTHHFQELSDYWRPIQQLNDQQVAHLIQADEIDILIDLSGHTAGNRLKVFALKPAPIQVTGLGYGCTTGLRTIDYRLADRWVCPPELSKFNSEKIVYLKNYMCWSPPEFELEVSPPPFLNNQVITFGCSNAIFKLNRRVIRVWSQILNALPTAQLYLKDPAFDDINVQQRFLDNFECYEVSPDRIHFRGHTSSEKHMAFNQQVDISLDPFPYNGGITTFEVLWMGVPVITLAEGARSGCSLLSSLGLQSLIARSEEEYIALSLELAGNRLKLETFRNTLRKRLLDSSLCDGQTFTKDIEQAYRMIWRLWCQKQI